MTVHFIGAGPGAADLITVRGRDLIARCPVCLYAGSIVPKELLAYCPPGATWLFDGCPQAGWGLNNVGNFQNVQPLLVRYGVRAESR